MEPSSEEIDLREPCRHCGNCCTGTFVLWYGAGDRRRSLEIDRETLGDVLDREFGPQAPTIAQQWHQGDGWTEAKDGAATDADALIALLGRHLPDLDGDGRLARLVAFAHDARLAAATLFIRYD